MGYLDHFGLNGEPFSNAPVTRLYFESQPHRQALLRVRHVVERMKGLAVVTGEIGTGKTTLSRKLLDGLPEAEYEAALLVIVHSEITSNWLLRRIALQLGVVEPAEEKLALLAQLFQRLVQIHEQGRKAVLLIDEAQMLQSRALMEEFRGLLNLEVPEHKLLAIVFFGLPSLERNLNLDPPLQQRVAMRCRLGALAEADTAAYVTHRLREVGGMVCPFTREAIAAVHRATGGTPRAINTICDNALFEAFLAGQSGVDVDLVVRVADELGLVVGPLPMEDERPKPSPEGEGAPGRRPEAERPKRQIDLAEIDRYLEGLRRS